MAKLEKLVASLLMWECGLKLIQSHNVGCDKESLLMWECGLKHHIVAKNTIDEKVTPYVGVWIETR